MLKSINYIYLILIFTSCLQNNQKDKKIVSENIPATDSLSLINDPKNYLNIQTNDFSEIDSSGILMFPLSIGESSREESSLSYKSMPNNSNWNIIFLNSNTNEYHLLTDKKMIINNYDFSYSSKNGTPIAQTNKNIFYTAISDDNNKDKKLTNEDPQYLFISDKNGYNFKQISPANYDLQNWQFIKSANKVYMTVKKDSDKNNKFDPEDETTIFEIAMEDGAIAKEVFSTEFKNKLKLMFDKDWKRIKK